MAQVDVNPAPMLLPEKPPQPGYRYDIEGLRGVTLLAILGFHVDMPGVGGGFVGPDIFFIISGFVITGQLWKEIDSGGTVGLRRFYGGRARRLLPVAAFVTIATMIASAILLSPLQLRNVIGDGIACALYVGNYRFALQGVDYFAADRPPSPFQHYWTLGVEEQFYLVWPVMLVAAALLIRRTSRQRTGAHAARGGASKIPYLVMLVVVAVASFAVSVSLTYSMPPMAYFSLPTRAYDLAVGCLLALTADHWRRLPPLAASITGWGGLGLIIVVCNQFRSTTPYPGTAALLPLLGTVLVLGAGCASPTLGCDRVLAWSPMRAVGRLSYSWYLWHWPVLVLAPAVVGHPVGLIGKLVAVLISLGLAILTLRFLENPLRYAGSLRRSPGRSLAVGAFATALAVCVGAGMLLFIPAPVGRSLAADALTITSEPLVGATAEQYDEAIQRVVAQVQVAVAASADLPDVPSNLDPALSDGAGEVQRLFFDGCLRNFLENGQPECAMADTSSTTTVALVGDSNAAMWTLGFQHAAEQRNWRLELLAKGICPPLDLPTLLDGRNYTECDNWRADVDKRLSSEHPKLVVLSMLRRYGGPDGQPESFRTYDQAWIEALTRTVQILRARGSAVLVLGPIPDPMSIVPDCLSQHLDDATACAPARSDAVNEPGIAAEAAAVKAAGGYYADLTQLFCTAERCPVIVGNSLVYFDRKHTTLEYAELLAPVLGFLADRALLPG